MEEPSLVGERFDIIVEGLSAINLSQDLRVSLNEGTGFAKGFNVDLNLLQGDCVLIKH